jgi:hypothetical protein
VVVGLGLLGMGVMGWVVVVLTLGMALVLVLGLVLGLVA